MNNIIELNKVSFTRSNGNVCADQLSFQLEQGQRVAITGSNGSGKSTLLQLMVGLHDKVQGEVRLFGQHCQSEADFVPQRTKIGFLFQDSDDQLFCPTVIEDVCFGPLNQGYSHKQATQMAMNTLKQLGIEDLAQRVSYRLSGGQKKLVSLATILVMKPQVLLLDEPTNGLDDHNYQLFIDLVLATNLPLVLVSHDQGLRDALTDTEYRLNKGRLTCQPTKEWATV